MRQPTARSTGKTVRAEAVRFVMAIVTGESGTTDRQKTTLQELAADFFVPGTCKWMSRRAKKGKVTAPGGSSLFWLLPGFGKAGLVLCGTQRSTALANPARPAVLEGGCR